MRKEEGKGESGWRERVRLLREAEFPTLRPLSCCQPEIPIAGWHPRLLADGAGEGGDGHIS